MKFENYITEPRITNEASYKGNLGFEEMCKYYQKANQSEIDELKKIIKKEDWDGFKKQIKKVIDVSLK